MDSARLCALSATALVTLASTSAASAAFNITSESRTVSGTINEPDLPHQITDTRSDTTKDNITQNAGPATGGTDFQATAFSQLTSSFTASGFSIDGWDQGVHLITGPNGNGTPQSGTAQITIDLFYDITDANNLYSWAYHGPINNPLHVGPGAFNLSFNWNGSFGYSKNFQFDAPTSDANLGGTFPLGIGSYHFKLVGAVGADLAFTPNTTSNTEVLMNGLLSFSSVPVPEPASAVLLAPAVLLLGGRSKRRHASR